MLNTLFFNFCFVLHEIFFYVVSCESSGVGLPAVVIVLRQGQNPEHVQLHHRLTPGSYLGTQIFVRGKKEISWSLGIIKHYGMIKHKKPVHIPTFSPKLLLVFSTRSEFGGYIGFFENAGFQNVI